MQLHNLRPINNAPQRFSFRLADVFLHYSVNRRLSLSLRISSPAMKFSSWSNTGVQIKLKVEAGSVSLLGGKKKSLTASITF